MNNKEWISINGKTLKGKVISVEELNKNIKFNNWERYEVNPDLLFDLKFRESHKTVLKVFASGTKIPSQTGAVFGICETRQDGTKVDRDHYIGFALNKEKVFLTTDIDKSKKHNYSNFEELEKDLAENPPHKKD